MRDEHNPNLNENNSAVINLVGLVN